MINEEISKEAGQAAQTIISYTIKASKEAINLDKEIRKKMNETLEKANGKLKSLMGDEMKINQRILSLEQSRNSKKNLLKNRNKNR